MTFKIINNVTQINNKHKKNLSLQQTYDISSDIMRSQKLQQYKNKNLAIANRLSVSCAHNTQSASVGLITHDLEYRSSVTQGHWKRKKCGKY